MKVIRNLALVLVSALVLFCLAPPPDPAEAQFTDQRTWSGTSAGTANAITVPIKNYTLQQGVVLRFIAANDNTGDTTININSSGAISARRITNTGVRPLVGGEIKAGGVVSVINTGSVYMLVDRPVDQVGLVADFRGTVPAGWLAEDGSCVSRTATATVALFAYQGTSYGVCDNTTTFALADSRGRASVALDNQGGAGAASRITNCTWTSLTSTSCGNQNFTLTATNQLPPYTPAGTNSAITPAGTNSAITPTFSGTPVTPTGTVAGTNDGGASYYKVNGAGPGSVGGGANAISSIIPWAGTIAINAITPAGAISAVQPVFTGTPVTSTFTGTAVGSSANIPGLPPISPVFRAVKL